MKTMRLCAITLTLLVLSGCASTLRPCDGTSYPSFSKFSLVRKVTLAEVKRSWIVAMDLGTLPPDVQADVIKSVEVDIDEFHTRTLPTDELWVYRFEKCPGCGWYTEGVVAVRSSCIAANLKMKDDM